MHPWSNDRETYPLSQGDARREWCKIKPDYDVPLALTNKTKLRVCSHRIIVYCNGRIGAWFQNCVCLFIQDCVLANTSSWNTDANLHIRTQNASHDPSMSPCIAIEGDPHRKDPSAPMHLSLGERIFVTPRSNNCTNDQQSRNVSHLAWEMHCTLANKLKPSKQVMNSRPSWNDMMHVIFARNFDKRLPSATHAFRPFA